MFTDPIKMGTLKRNCYLNKVFGPLGSGVMQGTLSMIPFQKTFPYDPLSKDPSYDPLQKTLLRDPFKRPSYSNAPLKYPPMKPFQKSPMRQWLEASPMIPFQKTLL
jgi:hypothetical protein